MARMSLEFDGLKDLLYKISEVEGDLQPAADEALTKVQRYVQANVRQAAARYSPGGTRYSTGAMKAAIKPDDGPQWAGSVATVGVGFEIHKAGGGGMHSVWMMYGTPRISPDTKLHNAVRGLKTKVEIRKIMDETLRKRIAIDH